eukprot:531211_1
MLLPTLLSLLFGVALADYKCPNNQTSCTINCGNSSVSSIACEDALITASPTTTLLTILCPDLSSCRNMTTICPVGAGTRCEITCTDTSSCDSTTIYSNSTETQLNCVSSDINKEDICTNNITIILSAKSTKKAVVQCALNATNTNQTNVRVCGDITLTTAADTNDIYSNISKSELLFVCNGTGLTCNGINITSLNMVYNTLNVYVNATLTDSVFTADRDLNIYAWNNALVSMSSFVGPSMGNGSAVSISMGNGSVLRSNALVFNDVSTFTIATLNLNPNVTDFALLTENNISIHNNKNRSQTVSVDGIIGDESNTFTATHARIFTLKCSNNYTKCGSLGVINVSSALNIAILINQSVTFGSTIDAGKARAVNITSLQGAVFEGMSLNAAQAERLTLNVYGETRGKNVIDGSNAAEFAINCGNHKSCSGDLELFISPQRTALHCVGTGCDQMTLNVQNSADEVNVSMEYCPCEQERTTLCITQWDIRCKTDKTSTVTNGECTGECCGGIIDALQQKYSNKYQCPVYANETMYICGEGEICDIDCENTTQYGTPSKFECSSNSIIDASMASSLKVSCVLCLNLNVLCPDTVHLYNNVRPCDITCNGDCSGMSITNNISLFSGLRFECHNTECSGIHMHNNNGHNGLIEIILTGDKSTFSDNTINGHSIEIRGAGDPYTFKDNNVTWNASTHGTFHLYGDGNTWFENNRMDDQFGGNYVLSLNNSGINCSLSLLVEVLYNSYSFSKTPSVDILIEKHGSFSGKEVRILNPRAHLSIVNSGSFEDNTVDIVHIDVLSIENRGGIMNELHVEPKHGIDKVFLNINGALSNSSFDARKSRYLSVICESFDGMTDGFCDNVTLRIPESNTSLSSLLCKKEGCQNMIFYTVNDIDDVELSLADCPCDKAVKTSCIGRGNEWNIYCVVNGSSSESVFRKNECDGECCGDVVNDLRDEKCDYSGGSKDRNDVVIIAIACGAVLVFVVIGSVVYCLKKKKKVKEEAESLMVNSEN